jgi:hypothetical protein
VRTLFAGEIALLTGSTFSIWVQSESQDADGTWQTHNTLQGRDWLTSFRYRGDADTPYVTGVIELARADRTLSMAPLITGSLINRNAAAAYAPFLDGGRRVRVKTACVAINTVPVSGDYRYVFDGYIDKVGIGGRDDNAIVIECRDLGALLIDTDIEVIRQYGSGAGTPVETVMQQILDDNLGAGAVTLYTPVSPTWNIHEFSQKLTSVMEAIRALAKQIGYEIRYMYDAANVLRLTFYAPDRAKVVSDYTIGPTVYTDITKLDVEMADVRNAWTVEYIDRITGNKLTAIATSAPSIAQYRRRPAKIAYGYSSNIDSATEAQKMVDAAVADTAFPKATEVIDLQYWPLVDIADLITLSANGEHYDTDQQRAVLAYEHDLRDGDGTTTLTTRGKPAGGYDTWMSMVGGMLEGPSLTVIDTVGGTPAANHSVSYSGAWDTIQLSIDGAAWIVPGASPLTVTPNPAGGAAKQYTFRAIKNGQIVTQTVYVATPPPLPPQATIFHLNTETDDTSWNLRLSAVAGSGGGGANLTWVAKDKIGFLPDTTFASGNGTLLPKDQVVTRDPRSTRVISMIVTDTITGLTSTARITVPSARPEINNTGNPYRNRPFDDGNYAPRATDTVGQILHLSVVDSRSYALNTHFNTSQHTADHVPTGAVSRVIPFSVLRASDNRLLSGTSESATLGVRSAAAVSRGTHSSVWTEMWDSDPFVGGGWSGSGSLSIVNSTDSTRGPNVLLATGYCPISFNSQIPFDPNKLYRFRIRIRKYVDDSGGNTGVLYVGALASLAGGGAANSNSGANYCLSSGANFTVASGWQILTCWIKGASLAFAGAQNGTPAAPDPRSPGALNTGTTMIRPYLLFNYPTVGTPNGTYEVDFYEIVEADEDASNRTYQTVASTGNIYRTRAYDDANYALLASSSNGQTAHSGVLDSRSYAINTHFNTAAHTMDNVPEGGTYGKSSFTRLGYADRAGNTIDASNLLIAGHIVRARTIDDGLYMLRSGSTDGRIVTASDPYFSDTGNYVSSAYQRGTHSLDNIVDGASYLRVYGVSAGLVTPQSSQSHFLCRVYKVSNQAIPSATLTPVTWDVDHVDAANLHDPVTNNSRITINTAGGVGTWLVMANIFWAPSNLGYRRVQIYNNVYGVIGDVNNDGGTQSGLGVFQLCATLSIAVGAGDWFECRVAHNVGSALNVIGSVTGSWFAAIHLW